MLLSHSSSLNPVLSLQVVLGVAVFLFIYVFFVCDVTAAANQFPLGENKIKPDLT